MADEDGAQTLTEPVIINPALAVSIAMFKAVLAAEHYKATGELPDYAKPGGA